MKLNEVDKAICSLVIGYCTKQGIDFTKLSIDEQHYIILELTQTTIELEKEGLIENLPFRSTATGVKRLLELRSQFPDLAKKLGVNQ